MSTLSPSTAQPPAIDVSGVSKSFASKSSRPIRALSDISFSIAQGEIVGLLGTNGAGKTTLFDLILGLTTPTSGNISVLGHTPHAAIRAAQIGAVLQTGGLLPELTVQDTLKMISSAFPHPLPIGEVAKQADLDRILHRPVGKCSGGEQQRVRFALAILGNPQILLLDEPTAGMDAKTRHEFWSTMHKQADHGRTIVFATHYLEEADNFAERIILLHEGKLRADAKATDLREHSDKRIVEAKFDGTLLNAKELPAVAEFSLSGGYARMTTSDSDVLAKFLLNHTSAHDLTIRKHSLEDAFLALTSSQS
ncbi:ABC transporter ATP-binding protein [Corynebacterium tuberculostearicum]|uniref:ABC transporter ATP-binding protein n=1 Tax=Corynebacterium tuberculostearicum TaxID=38304 RepID=UPI0029350B69|nr:ABC transporter ATP-binding protein [Corynebacterium tuberculostearicum]MDV2429785.1 ABC transporter ATP-binding protein [Corynebacterium tuberculostearicum]